MASYVSCAACGWRGIDSYIRQNFAEHTCVRSNGYRANPMDHRVGWPNDRETHRRMGVHAHFAINRNLEVEGG